MIKNDTGLEGRQHSINYMQMLKGLLIIIGVIALGLLAVNQLIGYVAKMELLKTPCQLCIEANPHLQECFNLRGSSSLIYNITIPK